MERINIWGEQIPGNSGRLKSDFMEIKIRKKYNEKNDTIRWILGILGKKYRNTKKHIDTYTAVWVAKNDPDYKERLVDVPYLIPYISPGAKKAVIVVPGGGYCMKEMANEGTQIAEKLQENGITAFVLWYRTNPYYQPIPLLDMQRAVRLVRSLATIYGYDENQIGAIGFSGGGAQVGFFANLLQGKKNPIKDYIKDDVDQIDDTLNFIGLVYPLLSYRDNVPLMFASFPEKKVKDKAIREKLLEKYDAVKHMRTAGIPHFICYGTKDTMVSVPQILAYRDILKATHTPYKEVPVEGAGHGYGAAVGKKESFWLDEYVAWVNTL